MPIYEYGCTACGHKTDILHGINEGGPVFCPSCGAEGTMRKGFAAPAIVFKGSGWAKKDRSSGARTKAAAREEGRSDSKDAGSDSKDRGSDSKDGGSEKVSGESRPGDAGPKEPTRTGATSGSGDSSSSSGEAGGDRGGSSKRDGGSGSSSASSGSRGAD
jgi:putative FmdB family regulatory protein